MSKSSNEKDSEKDAHIAKINLIGVLATAVFGFLGVVLVAYFGFLANRNDPLVTDESPVINAEIVTQTGVEEKTEDKQSASPIPNLEYSLLVDTYHGELPFEFRGKDGSILQKKGYVFEEATEPFTVDYLSNYDGLIIWFTQNKEDKVEFSLEEIQAIRDYIYQGGSVFLAGLGWVWVGNNNGNPSIEKYPLNAIVDGSGIVFTERFIVGPDYEEAPYVFQQPFMAEHPITENVDDIAASNAVPGVLDVDDPAIALIWGDDDTKASSGDETNPVILAASKLGEGRIVALQHVKYAKEFVDEYEDIDYSPEDYDNSQLLENILA